MNDYNEYVALRDATEFATLSPCQKSKRGVVIFTNEGLLSWGYNAQPFPFTCDGSAACRKNCNQLCVHAEMAALLHLENPIFDRRSSVMRGLDRELLHVKVVNGLPVASGPPSCLQCSRLILHCAIAKVWLLHEDGLRMYSAIDFHQKTLEHHGLTAARESIVI